MTISSEEQLQVVSVIRQRQRSDLLGIKLAVIGAVDAVLKLLFGKIRKKQLHHFIGRLLVGHARKLGKFFLKLREMVRHKQSAVIRNSLKNRH